VGKSSDAFMRSSGQGVSGGPFNLAHFTLFEAEVVSNIVIFLLRSQRMRGL
jgi:hypothetical protein